LWRRQYEALDRGEVLPECLRDENLQCLDYYPLTLMLGKAFERIGFADRETDARRLFLLIGQLSRCKTPS
jgi:hypothetical protein